MAYKGKGAYKGKQLTAQDVEDLRQEGLRHPEMQKNLGRFKNKELPREAGKKGAAARRMQACLLYTSPSPRDS